MALFPAIALPVETKRDYECPDDHLECLRGYLPQITKVLSIGWRATEKHFMDLLSELLPENVSLCAVAGNEQQAEEVIGRFEEVGIRGGYPRRESRS